MGTRIRRFGAITLGTALALIAGIALAAWLSSATGAGASQAGRAQNGTISSQVPGAGLFPGGSTTFQVTVANTNPYPVQVGTIGAGTATAAMDGKGAAISGCTASTVTSDAYSPTGTIAANGSATYTLTARMGPNAEDACQGATYTIPLSATQTSAAS